MSFEVIKKESIKLLGIEPEERNGCLWIKKGKVEMMYYPYERIVGAQIYVNINLREVYHRYSRNDVDDRLEVFHDAVTFFQEYLTKDPSKY